MPPLPWWRPSSYPPTTRPCSGEIEIGMTSRCAQQASALLKAGVEPVQQEIPTKYSSRVMCQRSSGARLFVDNPPLQAQPMGYPCLRDRSGG